MTSTHAFRVASRLGLAATLLAYGLIVVGSVVRTTGSGLACPDWPLCEGRLIPRFESHVLIEWFHRLLALLVSVMVFATAGWVLVQGPVRARLAGLAALAIGLLAVQVLLGALTVWKLLSPAIVSSHLAVALLLFATLLTLTLAARRVADAPAEAGARGPEAPARPAGMLAVCGVTAGLAYGQCLLGGLVSSNHAGLACPDWPLCNGEWFPALRGGVALQMVHRWGATLLTLAVLVTAARARTARDAGVRAGAAMAAVLTFAQIAIGAANVLLGLPPWASALHLANAEAILAMLVAITFRAALQPAPAGPVAAAPVPA